MRRVHVMVLLLAIFFAACSRTVVPSVLAVPTNFKVTPMTASIKLSWDRVVGASSYLLERSSGGEGFSKLAEVSDNSYEDKDVVVGLVYSYRLSAKNAKAQSDTVEAVASVVGTPLNTPTNFIAVPTATTISLSWDAVDDASSYILEKASAEGGFSKLAELSELFYEDSDVLTGLVYSYRLYAKNVKAQSEKVELKASLLELSCNSLVQEAEDAELVGNFVIADDLEGGNASGGKYAHIPDGDQPGTVKDSMLEPDLNHYISLCFSTEVAGDYKIKTWVAGFDDSDDSFWVSVNDQPVYLYSFSEIVKGTVEMPNPFPKFTENYLSDIITVAYPVILTLAPGEQNIKFYHRESDARLDKVELELVKVSN